MNPPTLQELIPLLQVAIGPVILISGVGLLLLSMTNRYARTIDRSRELAQARRRPGAADIAVIEAQVAILWRRARLLRRAIFLGTISVLFAAILILTLFLSALLRVQSAWLIMLIFAVCLGSLIASLIDSIRDVNQSLVAVKLELESRSKAAPPPLEVGSGRNTMRE